MRPLIWLPLALLVAGPLCAKPKVDVKVTVFEGIGRDSAGDSLSKSGIATTSNITHTAAFFMNVTVASDNPKNVEVAKNGGQWCIEGDTGLDVGGEYTGVLDGNSLTIEMPQKNGKIKKLNFEIFDHKWRKLADL